MTGATGSVVRRAPRTAGLPAYAVLLCALGVLFVAPVLLGGCAGTAGALSPSDALQTEGQTPVSVYADSPSPSGGFGTQPAATAGTATSVVSGATDPFETEDLTKVELLGVSVAADGNYLMLQFRAPARLAKTWHSGNVSAIDEATNTVYDYIPVVPVLGELFGRPVEDGQIGYVMLVNQPQLPAGSLVTAVLGGFRQEHVVVH
jgi:hypothetical protein